MQRVLLSLRFQAAPKGIMAADWRGLYRTHSTAFWKGKIAFRPGFGGSENAETGSTTGATGRGRISGCAIMAVLLLIRRRFMNLTLPPMNRRVGARNGGAGRGSVGRR